MYAKQGYADYIHIQPLKYHVNSNAHIVVKS